MKVNPAQSLTVTGGGSGVGISALIEGTTDIAQSSREIKFDEKQKLQDGGKTVKEVLAAYDALAVVVNPGNKVSNLTREQLEGIFTGKITNWKEVGGDDLKIIPYSRETSSGTYEFFKESVLKNKNYKNGIMSMPATGAIIQSVSQTKGAIGYVGLAYLNKNVKALHVSYDKGKTFVEPSIANAKNKTYPIVRPLFYYYITKSEKKVRPFIDYVLSAAGQKIVAEVGYITLK
jgi:phosphate transport system substrate-binding protein